MIIEVSKNDGRLGQTFLASFYDNGKQLLTAHISRFGIDAVLGETLFDSGVVSLKSQTAKKIFETLLDCLNKCQTEEYK